MLDWNAGLAMRCIQWQHDLGMFGMAHVTSWAWHILKVLSHKAMCRTLNRCFQVAKRCPPGWPAMDTPTYQFTLNEPRFRYILCTYYVYTMYILCNTIPIICLELLQWLDFNEYPFRILSHESSVDQASVIWFSLSWFLVPVGPRVTKSHRTWAELRCGVPFRG